MKALKGVSARILMKEYGIMIRKKLWGGAVAANQCEGAYPKYMNRYFKENNIKIHKSPEDNEILENTATLKRYKKKEL
jgi:beta-glucosidase/6-phospho-beta-glucosidase/beta-galactosidase